MIYTPIRAQHGNIVTVYHGKVKPKIEEMPVNVLCIMYYVIIIITTEDLTLLWLGCSPSGIILHTLCQYVSHNSNFYCTH